MGLKRAAAGIVDTGLGCTAMGDIPTCDIGPDAGESRLAISAFTVRRSSGKPRALLRYRLPRKI
jgi:hypothetical protein